MLGIRRREFITLLGGAATWPLLARAQEPRRIGVFMNGAPNNPGYPAYVRAFTEQLRKLGWIEGKNLHTEYRWTAGDAALIRAYAAELVALAPDVILAAGTQNLTALQHLSPAAPIIFTSVSDPLEQGFVLNLAHPGANITGFTIYEFTMGGKWLDLLKQMVPAIDHVAIMFNPETAPQYKFFMNSIESAAKTLGVSVVGTPVRNVAEIEPTVARIAQQPNGGLVALNDSFMTVHYKVLSQAAARYRVPAINSNPDSVRKGSVLMSYSAEWTDQWRQAGIYADRILKGTKAGDLPVQAPTKFRLTINLKTARELGIEVPLSILLIADQQVE
jgi:putative ABC transport system substrate-binding protein